MKQLHCPSLWALLCVVLLATYANADPRRGGRRGKPSGEHRPGGGHSHEHDKSDCECDDETQELVEVYTSTSAGATKKTVCVAKQICYKICTADPCITPTVECINAADISDTRPKPGTCPTVGCDFMANKKHGSKSSEEEECADDSSCEGHKRCCPFTTSTGTTDLCTEPVGTVADGVTCGDCPSDPPTSSECDAIESPWSWRKRDACEKKACDRCTQGCTPDADLCPAGFKCCPCGDDPVNNYCQKAE